MQLPGPHGTPVTLTFHRPANGRAFYEGCEFYTFNINLRRSRDFFPDKLTQQTDTIEGTVHLTPPPHSMDPKSEQDFTKFGTPVETSEADSKLVDEILKSLDVSAAYSAMPAQPPRSRVDITVPESRLVNGGPTPFPAAQPLSGVQSQKEQVFASQLATSQGQLEKANEKIMLLEQQIAREREQAKSVQDSQEQSIRSLIDQQHKNAQLVAELRQFILTQSEEVKAARDGNNNSEVQQRQMDEYTEKTSAALRVLNTDVLETRRERDELKKELLAAQQQAIRAQQDTQDARKEMAEAIASAGERAALGSKEREGQASVLMRVQSLIRSL